MLFAQLLKLHTFVKFVMILYYTGSAMLGLLMMLKDCNHRKALPH
ncbi:hypothetical protein M233_05335 [Xylella fastidiosa subsp. multiplex Griffin-1]|nr:hypothetical protein M233_05335 [Xylella fastidiosa subsp. multiplex Griffin-1]